MLAITIHDPVDTAITIHELVDTAITSHEPVDTQRVFRLRSRRTGMCTRKT